VLGLTADPEKAITKQLKMNQRVDKKVRFNIIFFTGEFFNHGDYQNWVVAGGHIIGL